MLVSSVDIGTNTVRCLVALCEEGVLTPVSVHRQIVRLGAGLRTEGRVDPAALARLGEVLEDFGRTIRNAGCQNVLAVGTSALRDMMAGGVDPLSGFSE